MNKTKYIILTLALCFFVSFIVLPLKAFAYTYPPNGPTGEFGYNGDDNGLATSYDVGDTANNGDDWLDIPDEAEIGDTFTGSSGTNYELQEENLAPGEEEYYNNIIGISADGVWVEVPSGTPSGGNGNGNGNGNGTPPPPVTPVTPVTPVSPSQYRCRQCRCQ